MSEFRSLWSQLQSIPNEGGHRDQLEAEAIMRLVALTSLEETIDFINEAKGPGSAKDQLVEHAFDAAKENPRDLLDSMMRQDGTERDAARIALEFRAFKKGEFPLELFDRFTSLEDVHVDIIRGQLRNELLLAGEGKSGTEMDGTVRRLFSHIESWLSRESVNKNQLAGILQTIEESQPFSLWRTLNEEPDSMLQQAMESRMDRLVRNMASKDPDRTFKFLAESETRPTHFEVAMTVWLERDADQARAWIKENSNGLDTIEADSVKLALLRFAADKHDLAAIREGLGTISDPDLRRRAEGHLWSAEREVLRNEIARAPSETIQSIIDSQSGFGDYWLEEAMATWVAKDFDQAVAWHERNWNSLPAVKAQYVAAAFAKHALQQQDVETARQWAALIHDPKTKARIDETIAKAVGGQ